jgi:hypothetical protein
MPPHFFAGRSATQIRRNDWSLPSANRLIDGDSRSAGVFDMLISTLSLLSPFVLMAPAPEPRPIVPKKLERVAEGSAELRQELFKFDGEYRHGSEERFLELEKRADNLAKKFPDKDEQARIWYEVMHVAGQSNITRHAQRVRKYAIRCLEISRDPLQRGRAYSSLASSVSLRGAAFTKGRREATEFLLAGYIELLAQDLPDQAPEWPAFNKVRIDDGLGEIPPRMQAEIEAQNAARREAEFVRELVSRRDTFIMQFRDLFKPQPNYHGRTADGPDILRAMARKRMSEHEVNVLMKRVMK